MKKLLLLFSATLLVINSNAQWVTNGPYGGIITCFAISGSNIFAGTEGDGVFLSVNNGESWLPVNSGIPVNANVTSLGVIGSNIFCGTVKNGIFLSTNNGASWAAINNGLGSYTDVTSISVSGSTVYIGTWGGGVFLSTDTGNNWVQVDSGLDDDINFLAANGSNIFAATGNGIYFSGNNGAEWTSVSGGIPYFNEITSIAFKDYIVLAGTSNNGVFMSPNNGGYWEAINNGLPNDITSLVVTDTGIFAGTAQSGIYFTTYDSYNYSWVPADSGFLTYAYINSMIANSTEIFASADILSANPGGVFLSTNNGASWSNVSTGIINTGIYSLAVKNTNIFAGGSSSVFSSSDGSNWSSSNEPVSEYNLVPVNALAVGYSNIYAGSVAGVFLSTDNANSWTALNNAPSQIYSIACSGTNVYAGTSNGMFLSTDNGRNWAVLNTFPNPYGGPIAISGSNIFTATSGFFPDNGDSNNAAVYLSNDNGSSWVSVSTGLSIYLDFTSMVISGTNIFAGTYGNGIYLSTNNGGNWTAVDSGLSTTIVTSLAAIGSVIFAGTDGGVFLSTNNGGNWTSFSSGLTCTEISSLAISGSSIYAGTTCGSVWQQSIGYLTGIQQTPASTQFTLYPNPTNNNFIIETTGTGEQLLQMFDITGQLILTQPIENSKTTIDTRSFEAGIYLVSLKSDEGVETQKLVVTK